VRKLQFATINFVVIEIILDNDRFQLLVLRTLERLLQISERLEQRCQVGRPIHVNNHDGPQICKISFKKSYIEIT